MKITTALALLLLCAFGLLAALYALTGIDVLHLLFPAHPALCRAVLSLAGVCALWLLFWLFTFRPLRFFS